MKTITTIGLPLAAMLILSSCKSEKTTTNAPAPGTTPAATGIVVKTEQASPHFDTVLKHLDVGAKSLTFQDHAGQRDFWIGMLEMIKKSVPKSEMPAAFDAATLIDDLGLCSAAASGSSLAKDGDAWLLRHYSHHPDGLPTMAGAWGQSEPFAMAATFPASTDLAIEGQLDASSLPKLMRKIAGQIGKAAEVEKNLKQMLPIGMTMEQMLAQARFKVMIGMELTKTGMEEMPVMPKAWYLKIRTEKELIAGRKPLLGNALGESKKIGELQGWEVPVPPMPGMESGKPILLMDGEDSLVIASSIDHLNSLQGAGEKLEKNAIYQSATNHFPKSGNLQAYFSPMVATAAREWIQLSMKQEKDLQRWEEIVKTFTPNQPWSFCVAGEKNGINTICEMPFALDSNATTVMTMLSTTSVLFVGARAWKKGSDRAGCIMNIRNVQQAIRGNANLNNLNIGDPIDWKKIIGPDGYLKEPKCPDGGTYTFVKTYPQIGVLACTCSKAGDSEGHEPADHSDW